MVQMSFNATQYAPRYSAADGLPAGKHIVHIIESEFKPTKDSTPNDPRSMLVFKMEAIDGPSRGGKQTDRLNLQNPNQQTVNIAYGQLAAYCAVTGRQGFNDTQELHGIPFMIEVGPQKNNPEYMEVKGVYFADGRDAASGAAPVQQAAVNPVQQGFPTNAGQASPNVGQFVPAASPTGPATRFPFNPPQQTFQPAGGAPPWARK